MIQGEQLAALAARHFVPTLYAYRENAATGGLMSYGANFLNPMRELGFTLAAFSGAKGRPTSRCNNPQRSNWFSVSRL